MPWQQQQWLAEFHRLQYRPHAGVGNDQLRLAAVISKRCWRQAAYPSNGSRLVRSSTDLGNNLVSRADVTRPVVDRPDQAIKRRLRTHGDKDHSTAPRYCGPPSADRCSHCVSHRSAKARTLIPDIDISSTLAMLSIQTVRALSYLATRSAATPGAAPVVITTSGRKRKITHATCNTIHANRRRSQRVASVTR